MSIALIMIPLALAMSLCFLGAYIWAVRKGQYDDVETPAYRILFDDEESVPSETTSK